MEQVFDILLPRHTLEEAVGPELAKQYRLRRGEDRVFMPVRSGHHYLCSCGQVNPEGVDCAACGRAPEFLDRELLEELRREAAARLEQEELALAREEEARLREQKRQKRKKQLRIAAATAACVAVLMLAVAAFWGITRFAIPAGHYQKAIAALAQKDYQQAHRQFVLAGNYKDAETRLERFYTPCTSLRSTTGFAVGMTEYSYDDKGNLLLTVSTPHQIDADGKLNPVEEPTVYTRVYDRDGRILETQDWQGKTCYAYNERGDVLSETAFRPEGDEGHNKSYTYEYDEQGRVLRVDEICSNYISLSYSYEQSARYVYDAQGRVAKRYLEVNYPASMEACYRSEASWTYDSQGRPLRMEKVTTGQYFNENDGREVETWVYDEAGRQTVHTVAVEHYADTGRNYIQTDSSVYDREGRLVEERTVNTFPNDPGRDYVSFHTREYNWEGRLTEEKLGMDFSDPERLEYSGYASSIVYTYDLLGRRTKIVQTWDYSGEERDNRSTQTYEYGADGMAVRAEVKVKTAEGTELSTVIFNENGLAEKVIYSMGEEEASTEYTYAYYYYPEGTEMPQNSGVSGQLYADGFYNG